MKKLLLAGMASTLALGLVLTTSHPARAEWVHKTFNSLGIKLKVNDTFKVTENKSDEVELDGTIYGKDAQIFISKDTSKNWSKASQADILSDFFDNPRDGVTKLKKMDVGREDGGIGDQKTACWASFTDHFDGSDEKGFFEYGVRNGVLYEFEIYYIGGDKAEDVANDMLVSVDWAD